MVIATITIFNLLDIIPLYLAERFDFSLMFCFNFNSHFIVITLLYSIIINFINLFFIFINKTNKQWLIIGVCCLFRNHYTQFSENLDFKSIFDSQSSIPQLSRCHLNNRIVFWIKSCGYQYPDEKWNKISEYSLIYYYYYWHYSN